MPEWRDEIRRRLKTSRLGGASEADVVEELSQHLDDRYAELRARGVEESEARSAVLLELDDGATLGERVRRAVRPATPAPVIGSPSRAGLWSGLAADVRYGMRMLRRAPGFTTVAVLVIALGIGANTAIFSVLNAVLLRPTPGVASPSELASIHTSDYSGPIFGATSYPDYEVIRESSLFADVAVHTPNPMSVVTGDRALPGIGETVSENYFEMLGVQPRLGRFFTAAEGGVGGTSEAVVISYDLWRQLGGDPGIPGQTLRVNGQVLTVIGVAPEEFSGMLRGIRVHVWIPLSSVVSRDVDLTHRGNRGLFLTARLRPDVPVEAAQERLDVIARRLHAEFPGEWTDVNRRSRVLTVLPESETRVPRQVRAPVLGVLTLLMGVVGIVLLIACSNVANLMLTRATARRAEMGVRLALGATRGRIMRQLLAESLLLASLGGAVGVLIAWWLTRAASTMSLPVPIPFALDFGLDGRVICFAVAATMLTGLLFGVAPALQASRAPAPMMRDLAGRGGGRVRLRNVLVVVQVAASVVLLAGGALFLRSLAAAQRIDIGFDTADMLLVSFDLATEGFTDEQAQFFYTELQTRVAALPGVTSVTLAERVPLASGYARRGLVVEGHIRAEGEDMEFNFNGVSAGYFEALGISMVRGRSFTEADRAGAPEVVIVNESFARRFWPGGDPLGKRIGLNGSEAPYAEVIGVVPDGKYRSLKEDPLPYFYYPYLQRPSRGMRVHVQTALAPELIAAPLRAQIAELAPNIPQPTVTTLRAQVGLATLPQRIAAYVLSALGALALGIAVIGLYGVVSFAVQQRTHEFGIRTALGAAAGDVRRMVVGQGVRLAAIGIVIGSALALVLGQLIRSLLLVDAADPLALAAVAALLMLAAGVASYLPARRATRVDPLTALRAE